jgi:hypothetical protein
MITTEILTKVAAHAETEGREDYEGRAADVANGAAEDDWAWPLVDADDAYVNAVGVGAICKANGLPAEAWNEIASTWLAAFRRGYEAAHRG